MATVAGLVPKFDAGSLRTALAVFRVADDDITDVTKAALFDMDMVPDLLAVIGIVIARSDRSHLRGHFFGLHEGFLPGRLANGWRHPGQFASQTLDAFKATFSHRPPQTSSGSEARRGPRPCRR